MLVKGHKSSLRQLQRGLGQSSGLGEQSPNFREVQGHILVCS